MLRLVHIARLAFPHSPEKEQRLLGIQNVNALQQSTDEFDGGMGQERERKLPKSIERIQRETRERLAFLNDLANISVGNEADDNAVLSSFFSEHEAFLQRYFKNSLRREYDPKIAGENLLMSLQGRFEAEIREITSRSLEELGPEFYFSQTTKQFTKRYMCHVLNIPANTNISASELQKFEDTHYVPNAYIVHGVVHFNMDHPDFNFEKMQSKLQRTRPNITDEQVFEITERNR